MAIVDLNMPRMGGSDMMKKLNENFSNGDMLEHRRTKYILSTAQSDSDCIDIEDLGFSYSRKSLF
jgi:CheY-like chemotaxis protein